MIKVNDILSAITIVKTSTGFRVDVQMHEGNTPVEDLSFLMIIERAVKIKQNELSEKKKKKNE